MTTPVCDEPTPAAPEELVLGSDRGHRLPRWVLVVALVLGLLIVAGATAWHFRPRPVQPLSLADLQNTYAGMVRSDGTNDASTMTRQTVRESPVTTTPAACAALIDMPFANRFPDESLDGVGTYWIGQTSTISLFTLRFADAAAARTELGRIAAALDTCAGHQVQIRPSTSRQVQAWQLTALHSSAGGGTGDQLGYLLGGPDGKMAIQLLPYENTLTWQYRYETGSAPYSPLAADQLMHSLRLQLDSIVAARPR